MMFNNLFDNIEKQQRVVQWGIYATAFLVAFMVWSTFIEPLRQDWADDAATIEANISEVRAFVQRFADLDSEQIRASRRAAVSVAESSA